MTGPRILVIQTAWLGDVILTTPLFVALKSSWPDAYVAAVVTPSSAPLLEGLEEISEIIFHDKKSGGVKDLRRVCRTVAAGRFDITLSPHRSPRSALIALAGKSPVRVGYRESAIPWVFNRRVTRPVAAHETERILELTKKIGIIADCVKPKLVVTAAERARGASLTGKGKYAVIAPSSAWATKRWIPEGFAAVATWLKGKGFTVVLTGGPSDRGLCQVIAAEVKGEAIVAAGALNLRETAALVAGASLLISNDSSPVHMASAFDTPTVAIFGATVPEQGFGPLATRSAVAEVRGLDCRPCGAHGAKVCPRGHFDCMRKLQPESVIAKIQQILAG